MTTPYVSPATLACRIASSYHRYQLESLTPHNCRHGVVERVIRSLIVQSGGTLAQRELGRSLEGRSINLITCGRGPTHVLLWSQMHGDESTATLALLDILNLFVHRIGRDHWLDEILGTLTLLIIPMLNPDGAERRRRETPVAIDINRDALALMTPEANVLNMIRRQYAPAFGFNLHDQELSSVGTSKAVTAIALLAPPVDGRNSVPPVRRRAMKVAALIAGVLENFAAGHIARYDDAFEARAFGDNMQRWGTSTVLIESGHWPHDREKRFIRKLNYVGLLTALSSIGAGSFRDAQLSSYRGLPTNGKSAYDLVLSNVLLEHPSRWARRVDIGVQFEPGKNTGRKPLVATIKSVGDLSTCARLETIVSRKGRTRAQNIPVDSSLPLKKLLWLLGIR